MVFLSPSPVGGGDDDEYLSVSSATSPGGDFPQKASSVSSIDHDDEHSLNIQKVVVYITLYSTVNLQLS